MWHASPFIFVILVFCHSRSANLTLTFISPRPLSRIEADCQMNFNWRGIPWFLFCKRYSGKFFGLYIGYVNADVGTNFSLKLKVSFSLVDNEKSTAFAVPPRGLLIWNSPFSSSALLLLLTFCKYSHSVVD